MEDIKEIKNYLFFDCVIWNENMYFFTALEKAFCKMDMNTFEVSYIKSFDKQSEDITGHISLKMILVDDKIFSFDNGGNYLLIYDLTNDTYSNIEIGCNYRPWGNFVSINRYRNIIFAFHRTNNIVLKMELESGTCEKRKIADVEEMTFTCSCQVGEKIYLFQENVQEVIVYNAACDSVSKIVLKEQITGCRQVKWYNDTFYILCQNGRILLWDEVENAVKPILETTLNDEEMSFGSLFITDGYAWILPARGNDIFRYDINAGAITKYNEYPEDFAYYGSKEWTKYTGYFECQDKYYLAMRSANYILSIDKADGTEKWIEPILPTDRIRMERFMCVGKGIIMEKDIPLDVFLNNIDMRAQW